MTNEWKEQINYLADHWGTTLVLLLLNYRLTPPKPSRTDEQTTEMDKQ